ncbi:MULTISPECIES: hypothetical protein [Nostocales]|uniref:Uncharacterized protein n=3 Tax=Nostocales TaxID=1161 RepID=A0A8S9SZR7_9CYAN|nr:hypothetical protein [Tolypothrix bouteillei]KAF3885257.1 hypothetical protein DA73_0400007135 [Tolypothrix bouteillei VB521301]
MSRNRPTTLTNRLNEIINQLEPSANQNHLKILEPNFEAIAFSRPLKVSQ